MSDIQNKHLENMKSLIKEIATIEYRNINPNEIRPIFN